MKIEAAVIQYDVRAGHRERNTARALELSERALQDGAKLLVLPELWYSGYDPQHLDEIAEDFQGPSTGLIKQLAKKYAAYIVAGSIPERKPGRFHNTACVITPQGQVTGKYRKTHPFTMEVGEDKWFTPGDELGMFDYTQDGESVRCGLGVCFDLTFPELFRNMALRGARIFTVPAGWMRSRLPQYELFCRSRAAENICFLLSSNYSGSQGGGYGGSSCIISPQGDVLAALGNNEGILRAELDLDLLDKRAWALPLADRKPFIDEIDNNLL